MEKTITKKRKSKSLKRRIGIVAVGGLSVLLTVCLSVGATLAWFAGSTWASNTLYMGGPVYVEMAGKGEALGTIGDGESVGNWQGGDGSLDVSAVARTTGTAGPIPDNILLPGQKMQIYSQARVFSTLATSTVSSGAIPNEGSGANTRNTSKGIVNYTDGSGRVTTTTTSILRARFSINIEFDPSVGFNNFTDGTYMNNYPVQSEDIGAGAALDSVDKSFAGALGAAEYKSEYQNVEGTEKEVITAGRRDAVRGDEAAKYVEGLDEAELTSIKAGTRKSVFAWKFVSKEVYENGSLTAPVGYTDGDTVTQRYAQMDAPFDGSDKLTNSIGYFGVWILNEGKNARAESDAFYISRTNAYLQTYVEFYRTEYGGITTRKIADSLYALDNQINTSFRNLVNDSSDAIIGGKTGGLTVTNGVVTPIIVDGDGAAHDASWLYVDPTIGNDTNSNEISTSTGGWWYLASSDNAGVKAGFNKVNSVNEIITYKVAEGSEVLTYSAEPGTPFVRGAFNDEEGFGSKDPAILNALLYEIDPTIDLEDELVGKNMKADGTFEEVIKVVSSAFPFVNGTFELPGKALTNVFANAKISFQISFQALQAYLPFSTNIDKMDYTNPLLGTAKALTIKNAIPIYNEAFDYYDY